jgi:exosortase
MQKFAIFRQRFRQTIAEHTAYEGPPTCTSLGVSTGSRTSRWVSVLLWIALIVSIALPFLDFFQELFRQWMSDVTFSYGVMIPFVSAGLIWKRRRELVQASADGWPWAVPIVLAGATLRIMGSRSGILLFSGAALSLILMGTAGLLLGKASLKKVALPLAYLLLMVPLPSYLLGTLSWQLQSFASTASASVLQLLGLTVYQDGNVLILPNYVLEVKDACSGTRSLFALIAMAATLGITIECKWSIRVLLLCSAPLLAVATNVLRIVGTGMAWHWMGAVAANETLHAAWGVAMFMLAVLGLLGLQKWIPWLIHRSA